MQLFHGGNLENGITVTGCPRKGRSEYGPGLYLTTNIETAKSYAMGRGRVWKVHLRETATRMCDRRIAVRDVVSFLGTLPLRDRKSLLRDVYEFGSTIPATAFNELMVTADRNVGDAGTALARFFISQGIDTHKIRFDAREEWVILFNPECVVSVSPHSTVL